MVTNNSKIRLPNTGLTQDYRNDAGTKREELRTITIPILRNIWKIRISEAIRKSTLLITNFRFRGNSCVFGKRSSRCRVGCSRLPLFEGIYFSLQVFYLILQLLQLLLHGSPFRLGDRKIFISFGNSYFFCGSYFNIFCCIAKYTYFLHHGNYADDYSND